MIPLGGYVKISGMLDENLDPEQVKEEPEPWEFRAKPTWQRLIVMLGGIIMNILLGILLFFIFKYNYGDNKIPISKLEYGIQVPEGSAGYDMGFRTGDIPLTYKGDSLTYLEDFTDPNKLVDADKEFEVLRDGKVVKVAVADDYIDRFTEFKGSDRNIAEADFPMILRVPSPKDNAEARETDQDTIPLRAYDLGFRTRDRITAIDGTPVEKYSQLSQLLKGDGPLREYRYGIDFNGAQQTVAFRNTSPKALSRQLAQNANVLVLTQDAAENSPLQTGDVLLAVDSVPTTDHAALVRAMEQFDEAAPRQLKVQRGAETLTVDVDYQGATATDSTLSYFGLTLRPAFAAKEDAPKSLDLVAFPSGVKGVTVLDQEDPLEPAVSENPLAYIQPQLLERPFTFSIERDGKPLTIEATTDTNMTLGVFPYRDTLVTHVDYTAGEALSVGTVAAFGVITNTLKGLWAMIKGNADPRKSLSGPVKIAQIYGEASRAGGWAGFWRLTAFLSMVLAIMNLLPIPVLDGGQVLLLTIEGVAGREIPLKIKEWILRISFYLVVGLMLLVVLNDLI